MHRSSILAVLSLTLLAAGVGSSISVAESKPSAKDIAFFESKIRPIFASRCVECHGADEQSGELRLDTVAGMFQGGTSGPPVVPGEPDQSLLVVAIRYTNPELQMPPDEKLTPQQVKDLERWVKMGAPHPDYGKVKIQTNAENWEKDRDFWSFQPPVKPQVPSVKDASWPTTDIDRFILAGLEKKGLRPAAKADKRTLIRRATFDLIGLPPTAEEVEAFLADDSPQAFAKVVDHLLASPHYGERWGRHWLDVVRYADSNGLDENIAHGNAWKYRDYVVKAFNSDKPYDQFLLEQLAGDLLGPTDDYVVRNERLIATGFLSLGPKVLAEVDETKMEMDIVDEQVDTIGKALLGLTLGCARCHDHKFDPIPTRDYYSLAGIFKSTKSMDSFTKIARWHENVVATPADLEVKAAHDEKVAQKKKAVEAFIAAANEKVKESCKPDELPEKPETLYDEQTKSELKKLREELTALEKAAPEMPTAMGVEEGTITDLKVHIRGSHLSLGATVERGFPRVLQSTTPPPIGEKESGRLQFAQWLTDGSHPLTARVMVNRIWRWHFGEGIVRTPDNFGKLGALPDNPALLDWLACTFVEKGWSIKDMHRLIMLSSTYQMSSAFDSKAAAVDPENTLYWRFNIRRLEAEAIRDTLLAVAGTIDLSMGGSMLHVKNREFVFNHTSQDATTYHSNRRSIYLPVIRNHLYEVFTLFDYTDASVLNGDRSSTTVAPQALFLMNGDLVYEVCQAMAERALATSEDDKERLNQLYLTCYCRQPTETELARATGFIEQLTGQSQTSLQAWTALCQVLVSANEFIYIR